MNKTKLRRGIGWVGKIWQYSAAGHITGGHDNQSREFHRKVDKAKQTLNKLPEFNRAAKKRQRCDDFEYHNLR